MDKKEIYQPPYKQELLLLYAKNAIIALVFLAITVIAMTMVDGENRFSIAICGLVCIGYFAYTGIELYRSDKCNRLKSVMAIVVSKKDNVTVMRQLETTYRLIPVNENGEFIDKNGKYDFFLKFQNSKHNKNAMYVGGIYLCLFRESQNDTFEFSERSLVLKVRQSYTEDEHADQKESEKTDAQGKELQKEPASESKSNLIYLNTKK